MRPCWMRARRSNALFLAGWLAGCSSCFHEAGAGSCWHLGGQLGVAGRGEAPAQVLEDVERQAADQGDDRHLPQERHRGDEVDIWQGKGPEQGVR